MPMTPLFTLDEKSNSNNDCCDYGISAKTSIGCSSVCSVPTGVVGVLCCGKFGLFAATAGIPVFFCCRYVTNSWDANNVSTTRTAPTMTRT